MENIGVLRTVGALSAAAILAALIAAGCGSNSTVSATIPLTPTPAALRQAATPVPTATAIPSP